MAPRVDFYVLPGSTSPLRFACEMAARIRGDDQRLHIHTGSREEAMALDSLLWTFRDISFLPHALADEGEPGPVAITIGWPGQPPRAAEVLINLSGELPGFAGDFQRVVEPVPASPEGRSESRKRYRAYRDQGWELYSHPAEGNHAPE